MKDITPKVLTIADNRVVIDKSTSALGSFVNVTDEDFRAIAQTLQVPISPVLIKKKGRSTRTDIYGMMFTLMNDECTALMSFKSYSLAGVAVPRLEAEWNPQTWYSGQNAAPVVCEETNGPLLTPSEAATMPYRILLSRLRAADGDEDLCVRLKKSIKGMRWSRMAFSLYSTEIDTSALSLFVEAMTCVWRWATGYDLGVTGERAKILNFQSLTGISLRSYSWGSEYTGEGEATGFTLANRSMRLACYRKDTQERNEWENKRRKGSFVCTKDSDKRLRMEAVVTPDSLASSADLRDILGVAYNLDKTWYSSMECLKMMENNTVSLEERWRDVVMLYACTLGLPLFTRARHSEDWIEAGSKYLNKINEDDELGVMAERGLALKWAMHTWKKGEKLEAYRYRRNADAIRWVLEEWEKFCGWDLRKFSYVAVNLMFNALATATLSEEDVKLMVNASAVNDQKVLNRLGDKKMLGVKLLVKRTRNLQLA